jgi:hypothetical protein
MESRFDVIVGAVRCSVMSSNGSWHIDMAW